MQRKLDAILDNQLAETGQVRAIILKARQLGISTYIGGRFYHRVRFNHGHRSLVMAHRTEATANLLEMVQRFHAHDPQPPRATTDNAGVLVFENDSGFTIATAGAASKGRRTVLPLSTLAHLSELAFWQNASEHLGAVLEAVPDAPGSEIIIESTAQGAAGSFYSMVLAAQLGHGDFQLIFLPWFEHDEYEATPPDDWQPGPAVQELAARFKLSPRNCSGRRRRTPIAPQWTATRPTSCAGASSRSTRARQTRLSAPGARAATSRHRWWRLPGRAGTRTRARCH